MATKRDYYAVLGVSKSASADDIKKAYRKLARRFHPDVNRNDPSAEGKFKEVQEAYDVLGDEKRRSAYDQFGHAGVSGSAAAEAAAAAAASGRGAGGFRYSQKTPGGATVDFGDVDLGDLFDSIMGGQRRGAQRQRRSPFNGQASGNPAAPAGPDITHPLDLTFEQAIKGTTVDLRVGDATGAHSEVISVKVPAGVGDGEKIRVRGKGQPSQAGGPRGDLIITMHVQPHRYFVREGKDILLDLPVSASEAAAGVTISVPTLEGPVELRVPPGISSGKRLRIRDRGVSRKDGTRGDQYCRILIKLPPDLTPDEAAKLKEIDAKHRFNPRQDVAW